MTRRAGRWFRRSLSSKLLALTILFVLLAEIVVLIPSVSKRRIDWLNARLEAAYLVGLALDAPGGEMIDSRMAAQLFATADILGVTIAAGGVRMPIMTPKLTPEQARVMRFVNLEQDMPINQIGDAWTTLLTPGDHSIRVAGKPKFSGGDNVDMFVSQAALRRDLLLYSRNILLLSLVISTLTAALVFWSLTLLIVRPVRRLTRAMIAFEQNPDDPAALMNPSAREDEIGGAERGLAALERRLQSLLAERQRLAALGAGISKISHDLRNILASAQLMSDRLAMSEDPRVRKLSPRLISSLDRAIALSRDTLSYARMEEGALKKERVVLRDLVAEVFDDTASLAVEMMNETPEDVMLIADPTQIYRALFNLVGNSVEALTAQGAEKSGRIIVRARRESDRHLIDIEDNGPGVPEGARRHLFEPFKGSFKPGGSGLGAAIAHEIARAHGGSLALIETAPGKTIFRLILPAQPQGA